MSSITFQLLKLFNLIIGYLWVFGIFFVQSFRLVIGFIFILSFAVLSPNNFFPFFLIKYHKFVLFGFYFYSANIIKQRKVNFSTRILWRNQRNITEISLLKEAFVNCNERVIYEVFVIKMACHLENEK